jgi:maltose O-acetyltransferase
MTKIDLHDIEICKADASDYEILTEIAFTAKRCWNYPESYFELWKDELTITKNYIEQNIVYKAKFLNSVIGFYSIVENKTDFYSGEVFVQKGFWLEHIFIRPDSQLVGVGRRMIDHAKRISKSNSIANLMIFVDPFAKGFYDKIGAEYLYESKSSIPNRLIPVYQLKV